MCLNSGYPFIFECDAAEAYKENGRRLTKRNRPVRPLSKAGNHATDNAAAGPADAPAEGEATAANASALADAAAAAVSVEDLAPKQDTKPKGMCLPNRNTAMQP